MTIALPEKSTPIPLKTYVLDALKNYFEHLEGHTPSNLYHLVLAQVEEPLLQSVMNYTHGNQLKAAEILGINRATLRKKLEHYQLKTK